MFVNLSLSEKLLPGIVSMQQGAGHGKGAATFAFIVACPIPVAVCFVWYKVFNWVDVKLKNLSLGNKETLNFDTTSLNVDNPSTETTKEEKLGAHLAVLAGLSGLILLILIGVLLHTYSYLEQTGNVRPHGEFIAFLTGLLIVIAVSYAIIRHLIIKRASNKTARPGR